MQPFSTIRVIDFTHVIAGPFCTYQLAVMGADVIKVEPPDNPDMARASSANPPFGDDGLGAFFTSQNANKRAIAIDLKSDQGQKLAKELIETADVVVENYRSGALSRLGLGYDDIKSIKPDIIYCSMTGFGQDGPNGGRTAYDNVIQAYSGLMSATGNEQSAPTKVGPPVLDYGTGIQAAFAISAALFQRTLTGEGQYIDIAMLDAAIMLMSSNVTYLNQKKRLVPLSGNMSSFNAGYSCYQTQSGLLMLGAFTGKQVENMWIVLGDPGHGAVMRNLQPPAMSDYVAEDTARISELLLAKTAAEWEQEFNANKVPAARVRSLDETLEDDHLESRTVIQSLEDEKSISGLPVAAFKFKKGGPKLTRPAPIFGQHTHQILVELGYNDKEIEAFHNQGVVSISNPGNVST
jgi:crotonobetainyl-CoA:carnitine CoA-transferase CaiB-like acyl-CoA transferase